jgi:ferrochelatase
MKAVLLMAHGAPAHLDEVEEYVMRIRHGRPLAPDLMASIKNRYRRIGGSPLLHWTQNQSNGLQKQLRLSGKTESVYFGMRYSHPFIKDTVEKMIQDGVDSFVALCLAPQFSNQTIGAYRKTLEDAIAGRSLQYSMVESYASHPGLIAAFTANLTETLQQHPSAFVIFTAHSLPERILQEGDPYEKEVKETARLVAQAANLKEWKFAYQSQGLTSEKWLGPTVEARMDELADEDRREILIAPIGFVCDHVEILYDIDVQFREYAESKGLSLHRMPSLNDSPEFINLLCSLVMERL